MVTLLIKKLSNSKFKKKKQIFSNNPQFHKGYYVFFLKEKTDSSYTFDSVGTPCIIHSTILSIKRIRFIEFTKCWWGILQGFILWPIINLYAGITMFVSRSWPSVVPATTTSVLIFVCTTFLFVFIVQYTSVNVGNYCSCLDRADKLAHLGACSHHVRSGSSVAAD